MACELISHKGLSFTICEVKEGQRVELFHRDASGNILGGFERLKAEASGSVVMAMNAGMYHADRSSVGLYIEDYVQAAPLVTRAGPGNFGMLPNGVFCLSDQRSFVMETLSYAQSDISCEAATQSGPMLVIDGDLHPRFLPNGTSRNIRNGVGSKQDGKSVIFAISNQPVTFYEFGTLFRDTLGMPNALYFDGRVSRLYAPNMGRKDAGLPLGPMVAIVQQAPKD